MNFPYLDAHTHAQFPAYNDDRDAVVSRARAAGVRMVNVGTTRRTSEAAVALARVYPELCYAAVGLHPVHATASYHDAEELGGGEAAKAFTSRGEEFDYEYYRVLAGESSVVAIGECGLDYAGFARARSGRLQNRALATPMPTAPSIRGGAGAESASELPQEKIDEIKQKQRDLFLAHMKLAKEIGKPLMIHCRAAFPDLIKLLTTNCQLLAAENPGIVHFFSGAMEEAGDLLALGFSFTFGGVITFARDYDQVVKMIPMDRILSETDAPYVAPALHRGKRNEPSYVVEVVEKLAALKGATPEEMTEKILKNAERVFGIVSGGVG